MRVAAKQSTMVVRKRVRKGELPSKRKAGSARGERKVHSRGRALQAAPERARCNAGDRCPTGEGAVIGVLTGDDVKGFRVSPPCSVVLPGKKH